jgi:hypothetical protein
MYFLKKNILKIRLEANQAQVLNCKVQLLLREYQLHANFCILNIYSKRHGSSLIFLGGLFNI